MDTIDQNGHISAVGDASASQPAAGTGASGHQAGRSRSKWRFLLVWPLIQAYRQKVRQSLSWRLAGSHHSTVLLTLFLIGILVFTLAVGFTLHEQPIVASPDHEAEMVADALQEIGIDTREEFQASGTYLSLITTSAFSRESEPGAPGFGVDAAVIDALGDAEWISIVAPDGSIIASSDASRVGARADDRSPEELSVATTILAGGPNASGRVREDPTLFPPITFGAYPLRNDQDDVIAAVVVAKDSSLIPGGRTLLLETVIGVIAGGLFFIFLFSIPALPAAAFLGIRRARAISRPIRELARAAGMLAAGDMRVRVHVDGEDEIADLGRSFNGMADRLEASLATEVAARGRAEQLLAANRDLVANVSHELRTPVALIRSHLEAVEDDPVKGEEYTRIALRETDRLERLVDDLFQLVRLENHIIQIEREPVDAASVVREAVESLIEPTRRSAGITMKAVVEDGDLVCLGDRARLVQVMQNLIRNAIRFTHEGGIILVGAHNEDGRIRLSVQDTGIGIAPDDLPFVFDRFYRSDRSRSRSGGGAGLGLAIARQLVEQMRGDLTVTSDVGEGSVFTICLEQASRAQMLQLVSPAST